MLKSLFFGGAASWLVSPFGTQYFVVFVPLCLLVFALTPQKAKKYVLLIESLVFSWCISQGLLLYLILTTASMFCFGIWLNKIQADLKERCGGLERSERKKVKLQYKRRQRKVIALAVLIHIGALLFLKYTGFFLTGLNSLFEKISVSFSFDIPRLIVPVGISFFTLQAMSYILDVYRGVIKAEKNFFKLALFISFFPQIVEGPICRYTQTADSLWNVKQISYENICMGTERFLYGMMKKLIIADRLSVLVGNIFDGYSRYSGGIVALGVVCYTVQLYMDFSGSIDAAVGVAQIFGITMPENFRQPFFSKSVSEFWQRWHITLGTWFKDYIFYPVSVSKKMKKLTGASRKKLGNYYGPMVAGGIALLCVWSLNGLWHGAGWNFIFFGMYHFVFILSGNLVTPPARHIQKKLHINADSVPYRIFKIIRTALIVIVGEMFFRAATVADGFGMLKKIIFDFRFDGFGNALLKELGADGKDLIIVCVTLAIILVVSVLNERGISLRQSLQNKNVLLRFALVYALILYIIIFGAYGVDYTPIDPLYAQF